MSSSVAVYAGKSLADYNFGVDHPFGPKRFDAFWDEFCNRGLDKTIAVVDPVSSGRDEVEYFHTPEYVERVISHSKTGQGYLDSGDTPARKGIYEATLVVVGSVLDAIDNIIAGNHSRAFMPIAGLHHARRNSAAGFCVFNDCGIAIEALRRKHGIQRVAYIDIDAHHGDGVFCSFESDPDLIFADMHEDGRYLYPGTGAVTETGKDEAAGTKLNIPMPPEAGDEYFFKLWPTVEKFIAQFEPDFFLFHCGADSLAGDPITHLKYSSKAHRHAARQLCKLADQYADGKIVAMGGGGYSLNNIADAWNDVVAAFTET